MTDPLPALCPSSQPRRGESALRPTRPLLLHCGTIWVHGPAERVPVTEDEPRRPVGDYGIGKAAIEDTTEELFDAYMRVLFKGPYFLTQALLPVLADGGAIVNVTSNSIFQSGMGVGVSAYASMKGGLTTLTRYMAQEFSKRRIRVNSVAPGATRTRIGDDAYDKYPEVIQQIVELTALGRLGEANDVGAVIAAVLSDDFRWVTGQHIEASGGARLSVGS